MLKAERFRLLGRYRTPRFKYGAVIQDLVRGEVRIVGLTDAKIPWPIGKKGKSKSPVLFKSLLTAVRKESRLAVRHWWGVSADMVWKWRKALDVPRTNVGTHRLKVRYGQEPFFKRAQRKAWSKARDPERCAKIAAAKLGKPRPPKVLAAMAAAKLGTRQTQATRRKLSVIHKRRGTWPPAAGRPWTKQEDELVRTLRPAEVVKQTGRTLNVVSARRRALGLPDGRANRRLPMSLPGRWTPKEDELVRRLTAGEAARRTGRTLTAVYTRRSVLESIGRENDARPDRMAARRKVNG
jgi:hypothetical protein